MINRSVLTGRLTRDPELRYTGSGTAVCSFTLAVDRQFKNQNNEREADFISCVIWRKSAENLANFTHKGSLVGIDGRLSTRNYEDKNGNRVYVTEVVVDNFALLEPRQPSSQQPQQQAQPYQSQGQPYQQPQNNAQPFNQPQSNQQGFQPAQGNQQPASNIDLSTLPFNQGQGDSQSPTPNIEPKQTSLDDVPF